MSDMENNHMCSSHAVTLSGIQTLRNFPKIIHVSFFYLTVSPLSRNAKYLLVPAPQI